MADEFTTVVITDTRNGETSTYSWDVELPAVAVVATIAALKGAARPVQVAQEVLAPYRNSGVTQEDLDTIRVELDAAIAAQGPD